MVEPRVVGRFEYRDHLVDLIGRCEAAGARLALADPDRRRELAGSVRREGARLSARLDGSPLEDATADRVDEAGGVAAGTGPPSQVTRGGWAQTLRLDGLASQDIAAVEYANLLACHAREATLAADVFRDPWSVLTGLHAVLCEGLVEPADIGGLRRASVAVHDGAQGQIVYRTPEPAELAPLLDGLMTWLTDAGQARPTLVIAGVVHERLLEWQPFAAANGRLARAFARTVLRARGLDSDGLAVPERQLAADSLGYHQEVAATIRRQGDLTSWLERVGSALADALEEVADRAHGLPPPTPPTRAVHAMLALPPGQTITVLEYARDTATDPGVARQELSILRRAGFVRDDPGTRGLRMIRTTAPRERPDSAS